MSRALLVLSSEAVRERAVQWVRKAPPGTRVEFKAQKRSLEQNSKLWAMLGDVASQVEWHGMKLKAGDWKYIFLDGLKRELQTVPNLDGDGFVSLRQSSSDLTKSEMSDLIELIVAWGTQHGVTFLDQEAA